MKGVPSLSDYDIHTQLNTPAQFVIQQWEGNEKKQEQRLCKWPKRIRLSGVHGSEATDVVVFNFNVPSLSVTSRKSVDTNVRKCKNRAEKKWQEMNWLA